MMTMMTIITMKPMSKIQQISGSKFLLHVFIRMPVSHDCAEQPVGKNSSASSSAEKPVGKNSSASPSAENPAGMQVITNASDNSLLHTRCFCNNCNPSYLQDVMYSVSGGQTNFQQERGRKCNICDHPFGISDNEVCINLLCDSHSPHFVPVQRRFGMRRCRACGEQTYIGKGLCANDKCRKFNNAMRKCKVCQSHTYAGGGRCCNCKCCKFRP